MTDLTFCPECGQPAEIQSRAMLDSTDGPVEHVRILCVGDHYFFMPLDGLTARLSQPWNDERSPEFQASRSPGEPRSQSGRLSRVASRRSRQRS